MDTFVFPPALLPSGNLCLCVRCLLKGRVCSFQLSLGSELLSYVLSRRGSPGARAAACPLLIRRVPPLGREGPCQVDARETGGCLVPVPAAETAGLVRGHWPRTWCTAWLALLGELAPPSVSYKPRT